jgi:hypothetical protein
MSCTASPIVPEVAAVTMPVGCLPIVDVSPSSPHDPVDGRLFPSPE